MSQGGFVDHPRPCRSPYSKPSALPKKGAAEGTEGGKASKWKQQSAQLRLAMQANKGGSKGEAAAAMLAETQQVSLLGFSLSSEHMAEKSRQPTAGCSPGLGGPSIPQCARALEGRAVTQPDSE